MNKSITIVLLIIFLLAGCGPDNSPDWWCEDCNERIDDLEGNMGLAEEIVVFTVEDGYRYWSATYWYWCSGISHTFVQNGCICEESTFQFKPDCD